jgi:membrane protease YdiL (CAAX protease family)
MGVSLAVGIAVAVAVFATHAALGDSPRGFMTSLAPGPAQKSAPLEQVKAEAETASLVASELVSLVFALGIIRVVVGPDWKRRLALRRPTLLHVGLVLLAFPGIGYLSELVATLSRTVLPTFDYQGEVVRMIGQVPWGLGVLAVGLGPALCEELWCRGFLGRGLVGRFGPVGGILLTSLFFGLLHLDPPHVLATFTMGICLHFTYLMTRSILMPMLLHFLNNSVAVLAVAATQPGTGPDGLDAAPSAWVFREGFTWSGALLGPDRTTEPVVYVAALGLLLTVCWALYRSRARMVPAAGGLVPPWQPAFAGVEYPPPQSGTAVVRPWPGWLALGLVALAVVIFAILACLPAVVENWYR